MLNARIDLRGKELFCADTGLYGDRAIDAGREKRRL